MDDFLHSNDYSDSVEDEEVIGETVVVHVEGQPKCHLTPFMVHKTEMTKDALACMLDTLSQMRM